MAGLAPFKNTGPKALSCMNIRNKIPLSRIEDEIRQ